MQREIPVDDVCASLAGFRRHRAGEQGHSRLRAIRFRHADRRRRILREFTATRQAARSRGRTWHRRCIPQLKLCTDNGAMVAMLGVNLVEAGAALPHPISPSIRPCPWMSSACEARARRKAAWLFGLYVCMSVRSVARSGRQGRQGRHAQPTSCIIVIYV